jgi:crotonobetainyl-CoA:carnitine CoA-transferase CaiB-like acyl-CoA transferase
MSAVVDPLPLDGMRVLDLADGRLQGVGRLLADLGADVVRVEPSDGSPDRHSGVTDGDIGLTFAVRNANKRSVVVDPVSGAARLAELVAASDLVLVTSRSTPYDVELVRAGRAEHPRLVIVELSDFGLTGPMCDWLGTPAVHFALSSVLSRSGLPEVAHPLLPPEFLAYEAAAAQALWVSVLAYYQACRTGVGDDVDFSVSEAIMQTLDPGMGIGGSARAGAPMRTLPRGRPDARHLYPIFPALDGWVRICVLSARQWQSMFAWLGHPAEFADPRFNALGARFAAAGTLYPLIATLLAPLTRAEAAEAGQAFGVPVAGIASASEVLHTDAFAGALRTIELADGRSATVPTGWFEIDQVRSGYRADAPVIGSAGEGAVFAELDAPAPPAAAPGSAPFAGLRVLDLGVIVVGAELGRVFADYGADVVKIESEAFPDGSRQSWYGSEITEGFAWGHRNKRSLGLNLRHDEGKRIFRELVAESDVVLTNFKPGTLESLGFGWDDLVALNPRIVLSESSAFGRTGPWSRRLGYGPLVRASTGLSTLWRYPDIEGSFSDAITIFPDHVVARLNAAAVAALLLRRERTGRGGRVSTAQVDAIFGAMADLLALESLRPGSIAADSGSGAGLFTAAGDDDWVVVDASGDERSTRLAAVLGDADLADWVAGRDAREAAETLQAAGVPAGNLVRITDFGADAHLSARGFFGEFRQPQFADAMPAMSNEARFTNLPKPRMTPAPLMAENTVEVVRDLLGLAPESIEALLADGVLEVHPSRRTTAKPS